MADETLAEPLIGYQLAKESAAPQVLCSASAGTTQDTTIPVSDRPTSAAAAPDLSEEEIERIRPMDLADDWVGKAKLGDRIIGADELRTLCDMALAFLRSGPSEDAVADAKFASENRDLFPQERAQVMARELIRLANLRGGGE